MDRYHELLLGIIQSDSTDFTREITLDVNSPEEIDSQYNGVITYGKVLNYRSYKGFIFIY